VVLVLLLELYDRLLRVWSSWLARFDRAWQRPAVSEKPAPRPGRRAF